MEKVGLGLRKPFQEQLLDNPSRAIDFLEVAPENWMHVGGNKSKYFQQIRQHYPLVCHGLSLSIGSPAPLDKTFLQDLRHFLDAHYIDTYTEHLSYCSDDGHLYDLMPIPFTEEAVKYVANRVRQVQEALGRTIALENVSYYALPSQELTEIEFINAVMAESGCELLLDVNNVFVNSVNHGYNPKDFINALTPEKIAYIHIAGHYVENKNLIIDTHGAAVIDTVWDLLEYTYQVFGVLPTLLERDFNIPALDVLLQECGHIREIQRAQSNQEQPHVA